VLRLLGDAFIDSYYIIAKRALLIANFVSSTVGNGKRTLHTQKWQPARLWKLSQPNLLAQSTKQVIG